MPELPEVETVLQGLIPSLQGQRIEQVTLNRKDLRFPLPKGLAAALEGRVITGLRRRAKYLIFDLDNGMSVLAHLGMSGKMTVPPLDDYIPQKHDHILWQLANGLLFTFNDARRFGMMDLVKTSELESHQLLKELGPEPFSDQFTPKYLKAALEKRSSAVKVALMDQKLVVGVGNIYACEALFLSRIDPFLPAHAVAGKAKSLVPAIAQVLQAAIASGGSTLRDYIRSTGEFGYFQHEFQVYGRENKPCYICGTPIVRQVQAGRSTFFCVKCQNVGKGLKNPFKAQKKRVEKS